MKSLLKYIKPFQLLLIPALLFTATGANAQQYFNYSQYMNNLTPINSAYSLLDENGSINTLVRRQWVGIPGSPTTLFFNVNMPLSSIGGSTGLLVMDDQVAIEHLTEVNAFFAKSVRLQEDLSLGVSMNAGIRRYVANYSNLDPTDPVFSTDVRETKPNVGFGVLLYTHNFYFGVSVPELTIRSLGTASVQDNNYFRNHYNFAAAYIMNVADGIDFNPAGLLAYTRGVPMVGDLSGTVYFNKLIGLGVNYRTTNEMAGIMSIAFDSFKFGYSYQFGAGAGNLGGVGLATHEVTLSYRFGENLGEHRLL